LHEDLVGGIRPVLLLLFVPSASSFIGCANVANLCSPGPLPAREIYRAAMARAARLIRQLLTESVWPLSAERGALLAAWAIRPHGHGAAWLRSFKEIGHRPGPRLQPGVSV
jgi:hypothetical protein